MTMDGKVTRPNGKWYGLSSQNDKFQMDFIRSQAEVLIIGKNSIINDNPITQIRYVKNSVNPIPIILIRTGVIPNDRNIFKNIDDKKPLVFCLENNSENIKNELTNLVDIYCLKELNPITVLKKIINLGYYKILLEGGPQLNYSFLKENLVHKIHLTIVPFLIGKKDLPTIVDGNENFLNFDTKQWNLVSCKSQENEVFLEFENKIQTQLSSS